MKNRNLLAALGGAVVSLISIGLETHRQTSLVELRENVNDVAETVEDEVNLARKKVARAVHPDTQAS